MRSAVAIAAGSVVLLVAVVAVALLRGDDDQAGPGTAPPTSASPSATRSPTPSLTPSPSPSQTPTSNPTTSFPYLPLWPFRSVAEAAQWQAAYRSGGHQPWHLDGEQTALNFTTGYLGFAEIDRVVWRSVRGREARVAVGYATDGSPHTVAAVLHLARIGTGQDAAWEVVGSRDSTLTIDAPRYGAKASSPVTVGGVITGVDESIGVHVRQVSSASALGTYCCVAAGGERSHWDARVTFRGATDRALTIVASTGGHFQDVERFAITGVRR
jgi:hypothetical protein